MTARLRFFKSSIALSALLLAMAADVQAGAIGVLRLSDGRQLPNVSLLDPAMNAARNALIADGHTVTQVNAISAALLSDVRVLWLPLLDSEGLYTPTERDVLRAYFDGGGRVMWIGDAGIYNAGDNSFLSAFGVTKLPGTYDTAGPALAGNSHAVASGPFGVLGSAVAGGATFGLLELGGANVTAAALYSDAIGPGAFAAVLEGAGGVGRAALVCDSTIFADALDENGGHRPLLRNLVAWLTSDAAYTPKGANVATGSLAGACDSCTGVSATFASVTTTGLTSVTGVGGGEATCGYAATPFGGRAEKYVGFGFQIATTAGLTAGSAVTMTLTYDEDDLHAAGFGDEADVSLFWHNTVSGAVNDITTSRDAAANTVTGVAGSVGSFLFGALIPADDCNGNGKFDVCEITWNTLAGGGPYYCTTNCDADCNENGVPDGCDVRSRYTGLSAVASPIGSGSPQSFTFGNLPEAIGSVAIDVLARGDFSAASEYLDVRLNGTNIGRVFETGGSDCPATPNTGRVTVPAATFNNLVTDGNAIIALTASTAVDANLCTPVSSVQVKVDYEAESATSDCNGNGVPDDCESNADCDGDGIGDICEIAAGALDCNHNNVPDTCDLEAESSEDCNGNEQPDECEGFIRLTLAAAPASGGQVAPVGSTDHEVCAVVPITAVPAAGHCFGGWSVSAGLPPVDAAAGATSVAAETAKTITANFLRIITMEPADVMGCPGETAVFTVEVEPTLAAGATYQWRRNGTNVAGPGYVGGTSHELAVGPLVAALVGGYDCVVTLPCGTSTSRAAMLSLGGDTTIEEDLAPQTTACRGGTVVLHVAATGVDLSYQWEYAADNSFAPLSNGNGVSGATGSTLTIANVQPAADGRYRCAIIGGCGDDATSAETALSVGDSPAVTSISPDATLCAGGTFAASVTTTGSNLVYGWWFSNGGAYRALLASEPGVSGVDGPTLTITNVSAAHAGSYRCNVSGDCPTSAQSAPIQLAVQTVTQVFTGPASLSRCAGQSASFSVSATGTATTFKWQFDNGTGFADIAGQLPGTTGATTAALSIASVSAAHAGAYRCIVTGTCGGSVTSEPATLHVPIVTSLTNSALPADASSCPGGRVVFEVSALGENLTYQWQAHVGAAFQNLVDGTGVSGARSTTLVLTGVTAINAGRYKCVVAGACGVALTSREAVLTITNEVCDCNGNDAADAGDIANGLSDDCNANGIPDECEIAAGSSAPGGPFYCTTGCLADCNANGVPDLCDISNETSSDCNTNGVPDDCETGGGTGDCNGNGTPDACDIAGGNSDDCNRNGMPDECEPPYAVDAGADVSVCLGQATVTLGGSIVASGSRPPYAYSWQIVSGSSGGTLLSAMSAHCVFSATQAGEFVARVTVSDSTVPPCVQSDDVSISVYAMTMEAGPNVSVGAGGTSAPLSAVVTGGSGAVTYEWQVAAGSPSLAASQFTGSGANSRTPTFTPALPGRYTLRVTARDANVPAACSVSDTLVLDSVLMTISAPADFSMCASGESSPLAVSITSPGVPPYSYEWSIESGSTSNAIGQFGGDGPMSSRPTFSPDVIGDYELRVTVRDSSVPPSEVSETIAVTAGGMQVSLPAEISQCAGPVGVRLPRPAVTGGAGQVTYNWTILPGAPSDEQTQFADESPFDAGWLFTPAAPGNYTMRLTATDSGTPACVRSSQLVLRATTMSIDAGDDFVTQAFESSRALGGLSMVAGGGPNISYRWQILSGPSTDKSQFSDSKVARPTFKASDVGTYALQVMAADEDSEGCSVSDVIVVNAITSSRTLPANSEGRVFMSLRIDRPYEAAEIRVAGAAAGVPFSGELRELGDSANRTGLIDDAKSNRRLALETDSARGEFVALVAMLFEDGELSSNQDATIRIHQWDDEVGKWRPTTGAKQEKGMYPPRPTKDDVGRAGVMPMPALGENVHMSWAVVDTSGQFALGVSTADSAPITTDSPGGGGSGAPAPGENPTYGGLTGNLCGAAGGGTGIVGVLFAPAIAMHSMRRSRRERPGRRVLAD